MPENMLSVPKLQVQTSNKDENEISPSTTRHSRSPSAVSGTSLLSLPTTPGGLSSASTITFENTEEALHPDPGTEKDFEVEDNSFAFSPGQLNKLLNPKSIQAFIALGGLPGIEYGLRTDIDAGLSVDEGDLEGKVTFDEAVGYRRKARDFKNSTLPRPVLGRTSSKHVSEKHVDHFYDRKRVFGENIIPGKKATPLWKLMWMAYNDKVLLLLTAAAVISLALGLYETFGAEHEPGAPEPVDWIEGVAICVAIIIVVLVGSLNDWQKERAFVRLNAKKDDREVKVVRSGKSFMINVHDVLVGDVLHLEPGDLIPVDGIFISGHNLKCDESSATGESDQIKKTPAEQVMRLLENGHAEQKDLDPFIISGAKVLEGVGTFLVTSVGTKSSFGKIMMSMRTDPEVTPLQKKLNGLATAIAKLGASAAALLFFVLLFRFLADLSGNTDTSAQKASAFMDILIVAITVIVVAVPEGLPLAVTLALAFATTRLLKENNLVRILKSCEVMGNATTICSDKTGTLTTNRMTVVAGTFNGNDTFENNEIAPFAQSIPAERKQSLIQSIAINSTAFESQDNSTDGENFIGSKTEVALLEFARTHLGMGSLSAERANAEVAQIFPFDSAKKCMGAVIKLPKGGYRLFVKGASEIVLRQCSAIADLKTGKPSELTSAIREETQAKISSYAQKSLRTIALTYRDFESWPPAGTQSSADPHSAEFEPVLQDLVLDGIVGIMDPVRDGVPDAVKKCQLAGVKVRMVTGDNIETARAIAADCGILTSESDIVMEGPDFRKLSDDDFRRILPNLSVLARSSPTDKQILVQKLKKLFNETVAVTGDGTNDGPALKAADVGFSMGIAGTEVAKEASSIVLMDDNFASIVKALMWGRAVNDAVAKFLQFQITVNITAVLLTFVSAVSNPEMHSVLTAVQLLWVNLIMDTLAALALATDPPTPAILNRKPAGKKAPLITINMWKMIIGQAIFQLTITFILYFAGSKILGYDDSRELELDTMVFNTFVWMQVFNQYNNRRLDNKFNIFTGLYRNYFFIAVNFVMVGAQIAIIFVGGRAFSITTIDGVQWAICLVLAALCLPWAILVRLFPDPWFARVAKIVGGPVAVAYRALGRFFSRIGKKLPSFRKNKKSESDENAVEQEEEEEEQQQRERSGTGSDISVPEIVVGSENEKDLEKGPQRV